MDKNSQLVEVKSISKYYKDGDILAVNDVSFELEYGKIYALMGSSGCGKSTLLNLIGGLDTYDGGEILYGGKHIASLGALDYFRREFLGFVFQFHYLIPVLTLRENVESAMLFNKKLSKQQKKERAELLLSDMGLSSKMDMRASQVSGGERQRAAIARALANRPKLILADEPTGNIDSETSKKVLNILKKYAHIENATIFIATHDPEVAKIANKIMTMHDGIIL